MDSRDFHLLKLNQESYKYFVNHWYESFSSFYFQMRILIVLLVVMVFLSRAQELSKSIGLYASTGERRVWNRSDRTVLQVRFFKTSSTIVFLLFLSAFMALWIFPSNQVLMSLSFWLALWMCLRVNDFWKMKYEYEYEYLEFVSQHQGREIFWKSTTKYFHFKLFSKIKYKFLIE